MGTNCFQCGGEIVYLKKLIECEVCFTVFHKGCIKKYVKRTDITIPVCCVNLSEKIILMTSPPKTRNNSRHTREENNTLNNINNTIVTQMNMSNESVNENTDNLGDEFDNRDYTELPSEWVGLSPDQKQNKLILLLLNNNNKINSKLDNLNKSCNNNHTLLVKHDSQIRNATEKINKLESKIDDIKKYSAHSRSESEIIIDNIPKLLIDRLKTLDTYKDKDDSFLHCVFVSKLFDKIQMKNMYDEILSVTEFIRKNKPFTNHFTLKIKFKSSCIRDFVLEKKRKFGQIKISDICSEIEDDGIIYINEFFSKYIFDLYMRARKIKSDTGWEGRLWVRSGMLYARAANSDTISEIMTADDLSKIK